MSDKFPPILWLHPTDVSCLKKGLSVTAYPNWMEPKLERELYISVKEKDAIVSELERKLKEQKETIDFLHKSKGEICIERDKYKTWIKAYANSLISASLTRGTALDAAQALAEIEGTK